MVDKGLIEVDRGWSGKAESGGDQASRAPARNGLGAALHAELAENTVEMGFDRAGSDNQARGNLVVGETFRQQLEDFLFADAEWLN